MIKYLTIPEVAKRLGVTRRTVYNYINGRMVRDKDGKLYNTYQVILLTTELTGREMRVSTTQLKRFIDMCNLNKSPLPVCSGCRAICPHCSNPLDSHK